MIKTSVFFLCLILVCSCSSSIKDPGEVLDSARSHVASKEYAEALKEYKWFFDNSTKIESAMFGVKHSYCVNEWRELGDLYEPALKLYRNELGKRKKRLIGGEADWGLFMEFKALCEYDDKKNEVVEVFLAYDNNKQVEFSKRIFDPIKEDLLFLGYLEICSKYTTHPMREAIHIIELHQLNVEYEKNMDQKCGDEKFSDTVYNDEAGFLLTVLKKSNRLDEYKNVKTKLESYYFTEKLKKLIYNLN